MPCSLTGLLSLLAPCFTQPTFQTFGAMVVGFVGQIRDCTVTGMLQAAGLPASGITVARTTSSREHAGSPTISACGCWTSSSSRS
jgi:hypothetical protein